MKKVFLAVVALFAIGTLSAQTAEDVTAKFNEAAGLMNAKDFAGVAYTIAVLSQQEGDKAKAKEYYEKITSDPQYGVAAQEYLKNN